LEIDDETNVGRLTRNYIGCDNGSCDDGRAGLSAEPFEFIPLSRWQGGESAYYSNSTYRFLVQ